jgi:hypothetical protein
MFHVASESHIQHLVDFIKHEHAEPVSQVFPFDQSFSLPGVPMTTWGFLRSSMIWVSHG